MRKVLAQGEFQPIKSCCGIIWKLISPANAKKAPSHYQVKEQQAISSTLLNIRSASRQRYFPNPQLENSTVFTILRSRLPLHIFAQPGIITLYPMPIHRPLVPR